VPARLLGQHGFDFAEFDAEAADLDLIVGAAQANHFAIGADAGQIARAVQARIMLAAAPRVGEEFSAVRSGRPR
jgi:hypothetical protein